MADQTPRGRRCRQGALAAGLAFCAAGFAACVSAVERSYDLLPPPESVVELITPDAVGYGISDIDRSIGDGEARSVWLEWDLGPRRAEIVSLPPGLLIPAQTTAESNVEQEASLAALTALTRDTLEAIQENTATTQEALAALSAEVEELPQKGVTALQTGLYGGGTLGLAGLVWYLMRRKPEPKEVV